MFVRYIYIYIQIKVHGKLLLVFDISNEKFIVACFSLQDVRCRTEACWKIDQTLLI